MSLDELLTDEDRRKISSLRLPVSTALRKMEYISRTFNISSEDTLKSVRKFKGILKYDLSERVPMFQDFYEAKGVDREKISEMFVKFPSIIGQDHERKLRRRKTLGKLIGMDEKDIVKLHESNPMSTGYGVRRNLAVLRVLQRLDQEGYKVSSSQLRTHFSKSSPYVPNTDNLNIKQAEKKGVLESMPSMYEKLKAVANKKSEEDYKEAA